MSFHAKKWNQIKEQPRKNREINANGFRHAMDDKYLLELSCFRVVKYLLELWNIGLFMMHENRGFGAGVCSSSHNIGSSLVYPNKNGCKYNKSCKWKYNTLKANQSASHHELYGTWYVAKSFW
jgi:hypothetical protein